MARNIRHVTYNSHHGGTNHYSVYAQFQNSRFAKTLYPIKEKCDKRNYDWYYIKILTGERGAREAPRRPTGIT